MNIFKKGNFLKTKKVPDYDYEIMKQARIAMAEGVPFVIQPFVSSDADENNQAAYHNAKILKKFYGISSEEILILTGCRV